MKNFILTRLLRYIGKRLDGHKTKFAGVGSILYGILGIFGIMFPDSKVVDLSLEQAIGILLGGLAVLGLGGKVEKIKDVLKENGNGSGQ